MNLLQHLIHTARREWRNVTVHLEDRRREWRLARMRRAGTANEVNLVIHKVTVRRK